MGLVQRLMGKALPQFDRRLDWRVDRKLEERVLPGVGHNGEVLASLSADVATLSEQTLFRLEEIRRWAIDDMEAANEATVMVGESLSRLQSSLDHLGEEMAKLAERLAAVEKALVRD